MEIDGQSELMWLDAGWWRANPADQSPGWLAGFAERHVNDGTLSAYVLTLFIALLSNNFYTMTVAVV